MTLQRQDVNEIGLYDAASDTGLPGLRSGNITACFHASGITPLFQIAL
jgi:hypothetical protein